MIRTSPISNPESSPVHRSPKSKILGFSLSNTSKSGCLNLIIWYQEDFRMTLVCFCGSGVVCPIGYWTIYRQQVGFRIKIENSNLIVGSGTFKTRQFLVSAMWIGFDFHKFNLDRSSGSPSFCVWYLKDYRNLDLECWKLKTSQMAWSSFSIQRAFLEQCILGHTFRTS